MKCLHLIAAAAVSIGSVASAVQAQAPAQVEALRAQARLNPNTASAAQIRRIPGVSGPAATAIVRGRPYRDQAAFHRTATAALGEARAKSVYPYLFVPVNLNTASRESIALIPGMTPRMIHEFEEYRPYTSMDQFHREIGKYVSPAETARLASYVTLR